MQGLSKFDIAQYERVEEKLKALRDPEAFLAADLAFAADGPVVRFGWPDWPEDLSSGLRRKVDALHQNTPFLKPVAPDTEEWDSIIQGWRSDPDSAQAIGDAFSAPDCFGGRVRWVFSRRDRRGKIAASCGVGDLGAKNLGTVALDMTWHGCVAIPADAVSAADRSSLSGAVERLSQWAGRRINTILEELRARLTALYGERFRGLYVFGSYARPDAGIVLPESSDLDVALILSDFDNVYEETERIGDITYDLSLEHGILISVAPIREADYREGSTTFTRVISQYAIPVK
jgi:predicted nucleotidyltransferase